jgi:hypothetical protein
MKRRIPALALAVAGLLAVTASGALATGTLDQHQTVTSGYTIDWIKGVELAQTFTAGLTGRLDSIDIHGTGNGHSVTIEIQPATGQPSGTVLDKQTVNLTASAWTHIVLKSTVNVTAGAHYAIVFSAFTDVGWNGACSNAYGGGQALVLDTGTWYSVPGWATAFFPSALASYCAQDYAFRTYVTKKPAATPHPTATPTPAAPTTAPAASPAAVASASASAGASASPSSEVLGATAAASSGPGGAASTASGGSSDTTTPMLIGGGVLALLAIGLLGFMFGRRRNRATAIAGGPGPATPPDAGPTPPAA